MVRWFPDTPVWIWSALFGWCSSASFRCGRLPKPNLVVTDQGAGGDCLPGGGGGAILAFSKLPRRTVSGWATSPARGCSLTGFWSIAMTLLAVAFAFRYRVDRHRRRRNPRPGKERTQGHPYHGPALALFFSSVPSSCWQPLLPREQAGLVESPFVMVFAMIGIPLCRRHHELSSSSLRCVGSQFRALCCGAHAGTLSDQGNMPRRYAALSRRGTPFNAIVRAWPVAWHRC